MPTAALQCLAVPVRASGRWLILAVLVCTSALGHAGAADAPLSVRNLAPVSLLYGVPGMLGGERCCDGVEVGFRVAQASQFTAASTDGVQVFFDGETTAIDYQLRGNFGERMEWGVVLPLVMHSGGFLDSMIDGFHNAFGLPEGGRDLARSDRLDYLVRVDGVTFADYSSIQRGFGDVRGWLGYALHASPQRSVILRAALKLPTGRSDRLTGSEAVDASAWVEWSERALLQRLGVVVNLGLGAAVLGDGELSPRTQESWSLFGHFGLARTVGERLTLLGQLDAHSRMHDRAVPAFAGRALLGTLGARYQVTPRFQFEFAMIEDLKTRSTSDVVFQLQLDASF